MNNIVKFAKRFLMTEPFFMDGFEYQFVSVEPEDEWAIDIVVNVILPKKGQSYLRARFSYNISQIMETLSEYYGTTIPYNVSIYVEGKPVTSKLYISPEDSDEIMTSLNLNVSKIKVPKMLARSAFGGAIYIQADISFEKNENYEFANMQHSEINLYFLYNLSNIELSLLNRGVETNFTKISSLDDRINKFATIINDLLQDNDKFRDRIESIIYNILEPSLKLNDTDFYIDSNYWINKINGNKVEPESIGDLKLLDFFNNPS